MRGAERCSCRLRAPGPRAGRAARFGGQRGAERGAVGRKSGGHGWVPLDASQRGERSGGGSSPPSRSGSSTRAAGHE